MDDQPPGQSPETTSTSRPANLADGRWLGDFEPLSDFERVLVASCAKGKMLVADNKRPEQPDPANTIRATLIRFLLLGGDASHPVHEQGVAIKGAWISGDLDISGATCAARFLAASCRFAGQVRAVGATIQGLFLTDSMVPGLLADGMTSNGSVILRGKFVAEGLVQLRGATINGEFSCDGATFSNKGGVAIAADSITVASGLFLRNGFRAFGEVRLMAAQIGGTLSCINGAFSNPGGRALSIDRIFVAGGVFLRDGFRAEGEVRLLGAQIKGSLSCIGGHFHNAGGQAFNASRASAGVIFLRDGFTSEGEVRLTNVRVGGAIDCSGGAFSHVGGTALKLDGAQIGGTLNLSRSTISGDISLIAASATSFFDRSSSQNAGSLILDGFEYSRIDGFGNAPALIAWLERQPDDHLGAGFRSQPWEQLSKVLRDVGHFADAAEIAMHKQKMLRTAGKIGRRIPNDSLTGPRKLLNKAWVGLANASGRSFHRFYGSVAGYGHRPFQIVSWMLVMTALWSLAYYAGRHYGLIGPTNPLIHHSAELRACGTAWDPGAIPWTSPDCPVPPEYSTFQPFFYSLDIILPLIDLHQEVDWGPIVTNSAGEPIFWGRLLRLLMWFQILFGWLASLMLVAIVGRLVEKD